MTADSSRHRQATLDARSTLLAQLTAALVHLRGTSVSDSSVHSARKSIKQARATLRLMRDALPARTFRTQNLALRDAARPLNATRDAKVLIDALDRLAKDDEVETSSIKALRRMLVSSLDEARRVVTHGRSGVALARRRLRAAHRRAARWPADDDGWPVLRKGLRRTYSRGRRGLSLARAKRSTAHLHEWRKQTKYLWHQLQFLQPIRRGAIGALAGRTRKLSDYLGDDHDLAVLREQALANKAAFDDKKALRALLAAIDRSREELQTRALELGARIYADNASRFTSRFDRYWRAEAARYRS